MTALSLTLLPALITKNKAIITLGGFTLSLILLLFVCAVYTGGSWFAIACASVICGMSLMFLPIVLNRICLPNVLANKKTLLYFSINTLLIYLLLFVCNIFVNGTWFFSIAIPIATFGLLFPWGMMLIIRYTKINGFFKTSACLGLASVYTYFSERFVNNILGEIQSPKFSFDFSDWSTNQAIDSNIDAIIVFAVLGLAVIFSIVGLISSLNKNNNSNNIKN